MDASIESILLRRTGKLVVAEGAASTPLPLLTTLQQILEGIGYSLSAALFARLRTLGAERAEPLCGRLVEQLRQRVGADRPFRPLYPDFPQQVMSASEAELFVNALLHYWGIIDQIGTPSPREPRRDRNALRMIDLLEHGDAEQVIRHLLAARTPFSAEDREDVRQLVSAFGEAIAPMLPVQLPCKENMAVIVAALLQSGVADTVRAERHVHTATDVLRIVVALSDGDVSLAEPTRFGRLSRALRTQLLDWIERSADPLEAMQRHRPRWIRLGERLHPGEYATRFPQTATAFRQLRNGDRAVSFNARVEAAVAAGNLPAAIATLQKKPGELARRLDHLLRIGNGTGAVVAAFERCGESVSTAVLLQVLTHFKQRPQHAALRVFFPKGQVACTFAAADTRAALDPSTIDAIVAACRRLLLNRFAQLPPLGACYVDPRLSRYLVPFSQRSAAKALRTITRGSRVPLPPCSTLRLFIWWRNGKARTDIDLSAALYGNGYAYIDTLAYYNLRNFGAHHSGDVVDAPHGACEFIDIDRQRCRATGVRYVVMTLTSYTRQPYCDLPECHAGWMARSAPASGDVFEPAAVVDRFDIASNTKFCLPLIFDLEAEEAVWCDIALTTRPRHANNVDSHLRGVALMLRAMTQLRKTSLHTLFELHAAARGRRVGHPQQADTVFSVDAGLTPFDRERVGAEFL